MKLSGCISLIFLISSLSVFADPAVWPTQGGSVARTGSSPFAGPEQGCIAWEFEMGGAVSGSAAIGQGGEIYAASEDGFLYTVDPNGSRLWGYDAGSPVTGSPTIGSDGTIYIGTSAGALHAIDPNGSFKWSAATQGAIYSTPAIVNDRVIAGSLDGSLYAFDNDGASVWDFSTNHPDSIVAGPSIGPDGTIYVGRLYDPKLYALDPADGSILWSRDLSHRVIPDDPSTNLVQTGYQVSPVIHPNGLILTAPGHDDQLYALNPADGEIVWALNLAQFPHKPLHSTITDTVYKDNYGYSDIWSEPVIGPDGTIYVSMDDMFLRAVNPDGTLKWIQRVGMYGGLTMTVDVNGLIYGASDDKTLYVLDPLDGTIISVLTLYDTLTSAASLRNEEWLSYPVLGADGFLYVSSSKHKLYAIQSGEYSSQDLHWVENLNANPQVNLQDLARFADAWQTCLNTIFPAQQCMPLSGWYPLYFPYHQADMNRDFYVNIDDLAVLADNWLKEEN